MTSCRWLSSCSNSVHKEGILNKRISLLPSVCLCVKISYAPSFSSTCKRSPTPARVCWIAHVAIVHVLSILVTFHFRTSFMVQCLSTSCILRDRFKHSQTTELLSKDSICAAVELILVRFTAVYNSSKTSGSLGVFTTVLIM